MTPGRGKVGVDAGAKVGNKAGLGALLLTIACSAQAADPIVIAHRGASGYLPEHTLAGYEFALKLGADCIEPDLQSTSDNVLVAMHDDTLQRTTNVAALFGPRNGGYKVADFSLSEIATLTVRPTGTALATVAGFAPINPELRVPSFQQVIDFAKSQGKARGVASVCIYPEAKQADPAMEDQILATLVRNGYAEGEQQNAVFIQSFSDATIRSLDAKQRKAGTEMPLVLLGNAIVTSDGSARMRVRGGTELKLDEVAGYAEAVAVSIDNATYPITKAFVDQAHAAGLQVVGWTFAQPDRNLAADEYRKFLDMGLDGMFSNYADMAVAARNRFVGR